MRVLQTPASIFFDVFFVVFSAAFLNDSGCRQTAPFWYHFWCIVSLKCNFIDFPLRSCGPVGLHDGSSKGAKMTVFLSLFVGRILKPFWTSFGRPFCFQQRPPKQARGTTGEPSFSLTGSTKTSLRPFQHTLKMPPKNASRKARKKIPK